MTAVFDADSRRRGSPLEFPVEKLKSGNRGRGP